MANIADAIKRSVKYRGKTQCQSWNHGKKMILMRRIDEQAITHED